MKKKSVFLAVLLSSVFSVTVFANSAPVYWEKTPSSSVMTLTEDTPIEVLREKLVFDFSKEEKGHFSIQGDVSAAYSMKNTREEAHLSTMVFPYIGYLGQQEEVQIEVDGVSIPYEPYYGEIVQSRDFHMEDALDLPKLLQEIREEPYEPRSYDKNQEGTLYEVTFTNLKEGHFHGMLTFQLKDPESKLLVFGINSYGYTEGGPYEVGASTRDESVIQLFVLGEPIDVVSSARSYEDGPLIEGVDFQVTMKETQGAFSEVLAELLVGSVYFESFPERTLQVDNVLYGHVDELFDRSPMITEDDLSSMLSQERMVFLVYEVAFKAQETKDVTVRYQQEGSMDRRETKDPMYTYEYLLSPAGHYKDFKDLTIEVVPGELYPYILSSTLPLARQEDGRYRQTFDTLPEENLSFTLFTEEELTFKTKVEGYFSRNFYGVLIVGFLAGSLVLFVLMVMVVYKIIGKLRRGRASQGRRKER